MIRQIRNWLYEPRVRGVGVDDEKLLELHSSVLHEKTLLKSAFETFYLDMINFCEKYFSVDGKEIEMGTGAGFFKKLRPTLITSDIRTGPNIDIELNAQKMALEDSSVRCLYAINVFHHLPNPDDFFNELKRVLRSGGGCILIEPHGGFSSALVHRHLHTDEHFDPNAVGWITTEIKGPLSGANQALAEIVFNRDLEVFKAKHGKELEIVFRGYELNALRYLLSGGLNFRQLVPSFFETALRKIESIAKPLARHWSLHQIIVIRKI